MSNGNAGKGSRFRKVDGDKYRKNYDRVFGKQEKKNMAQDKTGHSFGDIDKHQEKQGLYNRIRSILEALQRLLADDHAFVRACQGYIPHLKRTDKDCGSLPFYSQTYTSQKTNKNHCLLCVISRVVQDYWLVADDNVELTGGQVTEVYDAVDRLEHIVANGFDQYRVAGKFPEFHLLTVDEIDALEQVIPEGFDAAAEQAEIEAGAETSDPTEAGSEESSSTQSEQEQEDGTDEQIADTADDNDSGDEDTEAPAEPAEQAAGSTDDQLSTELADKCSGDCDTCDDQVCDTAEAKGIPDVPAEEDQEETTTLNRDDDLTVELTEETEAERQQGQDDDGEPYPDQESLS